MGMDKNFLTDRKAVINMSGERALEFNIQIGPTGVGFIPIVVHTV